MIRQSEMRPVSSACPMEETVTDPKISLSSGQLDIVEEFVDFTRVDPSLFYPKLVKNGPYSLESS